MYNLRYEEAQNVELSAITIDKLLCLPRQIYPGQNIAHLNYLYREQKAHFS